MDITKRKETDYSQRKFLKTTERSVFYTSERKDYNPFRNIYGQRRYMFVVDWQICDEEPLEEENLHQNLMF